MDAAMMAPSRILAHGRPCPYCRRPMNRDEPRRAPTRDHIVPESKGGRETLIACYTCNTIKGDMMPDVWCAFMETFPRWWDLSKAALRRARRENFFTPGYKPPKHMRDLVARRPPCVVPPELIYSTIKAQDDMLPRSQPSAREAERTAKWGPRMSRDERARLQQEMDRVIADASDQPPLSEPEALP